MRRLKLMKAEDKAGSSQEQAETAVGAIFKIEATVFYAMAGV